ncbi:MAG TPA: GWxTD domain-containing protein [Bryobacteraceae bacterium]|nr:GWxTD domain-containing protein [Bryobacteraceae bacterium]
MNTVYSVALAAALVHFIWEGAIAALLLALIVSPPFGLRRPASARARYGAACLTLVAMAGAFTLTLVMLWPLSAGRLGNGLIPWQMVPLLREPARNAVAARVESHLWWLAPLWMLGACLFTLRSVASWWAARRLRSTAVCAVADLWQHRVSLLAAGIRLSRPVTLLESGLVQVPVVLGFLRPVILLPAGLLAGFPPEQIEYYLLHELAHVRRLDYLVNLLQTAVEDLLFYHPAVWWVSAVIRAERENCCDDIAATQGSGHDLAVALAALEERRSGARELALAATGGQLANRIRRLLGQPESRRAGIAPVILAAALFASLAVAFGATKRQAPLPAPPPKPLIAQAQPTPQPVQQAAPSPTNIPVRYRKWLDEEVVYIIQPEERAAFLRLGTEAELQQFIEQFWLRRDPTPATDENEYREEHYRRIAFANDQFRFNRVAGWRSDRGQVYIKFGPPDDKDIHPADTPPRETWLYRHIDGIGNDVLVEFVDTGRNGEYRWTRDHPNGAAR